MKSFAALLDLLSFTYSNNKKIDVIKSFLQNTPDPDRGFAIAIIAGVIKFPNFKSAVVKELLHEQIDPVLFKLSYDYVGDLSETVALLWKSTTDVNGLPLPALSEIIDKFNTLPKAQVKPFLKQLLDQSTAKERWALLKLGSSSLRIGVSARFIKQAVAQYGSQYSSKSVEEIEHIWHGLKPPYLGLFEWLEDRGHKPDIINNIYFHPVMLAQPLDEASLDKIQPDLFAIERKIDGIRVQLIYTLQGKALFTRTGDEISSSFPEILQAALSSSVVLDGELVIKKTKDHAIGSFNELQQRLNRKAPTQKLRLDSPAHIIVYDILFLEQQDVRALSFLERRALLEQWYWDNKPNHISLSEVLEYNSSTDLHQLKHSVLVSEDVAVEGLMLKRKSSPYIAGRPSGQWYKWKKDPYLVDAVLMYAQRGHGKRSSYYSDYTFGLWEGTELLPIGKAYFGFTDEELKLLDRWVRNHTVKKFGPVREVARGLVLEIAFDAVNRSAQHKSGYALRFPRINRIRWDKPVEEADLLQSLALWV